MQGPAPVEPLAAAPTRLAPPPTPAPPARCQRLTLQVRGDTLDGDDFARRLARPARPIFRKGAPRRDAAGRPLKGTYDTGYTTPWVDWSRDANLLWLQSFTI